jgi:hypothetical protein
MKDKTIMVLLGAACVALLWLAIYFKNHQQEIIVNLKPVGNSSSWVPSPWDYK